MKSCVKYYLCVVIILFIMQTAFSSFSFAKLVFSHSAFFVLSACSM